MKILIIGGYVTPSTNHHFSDFKTANLALGFKALGHEVCMAEETDHHNLVPTVPFHKIDPYNYHLIIFTRENFMRELYNHHWIVKKLCKREVPKKGKFPIICARYGKHNWYKDLYENINEFYNAFDYHFPQEYNLCKRFIAENNGDPEGKIWVSPMGVPEEIRITASPYQDTNQKIIIYIGRLRQLPSRYDFMVEFMRRLSDKYRLYIIPGSFDRTDEKGKQNPKDADSISWLKNRFCSSDNIKVLEPIPWGLHWDYLYYADYGIDFTPSVNSKGYGGGNAKLIEYMRAGLPSITEPSTINQDILSQCNGGVVANSSYLLHDYVKAFRKLEATEWDRKEMSRIIVQNHSWKRRASEILSNISIIEDTNLMNFSLGGSLDDYDEPI